MKTQRRKAVTARAPAKQSSRPSRSPGQRHWIKVKFDAWVHKALLALARKRGVPLSTFVRHAVLAEYHGHTIWRRPDLEATGTIESVRWN